MSVMDTGDRGYVRDDPRLASIAALYDAKVDSGINSELAAIDGLFFNHNGILMPGETLDTYRRRIRDEGDLTRTLHLLEANTVRRGAQFLGTPEVSFHGLDAGCGAGGSAVMIHTLFGCSLTGYTLSAKQADFAEKLISARGVAAKVQCGLGDYFELPEPTESFDFVWACESTEHAGDLPRLFVELRRVARSFSRLVVVAWVSEYPFSQEALDMKAIVDDAYRCDCRSLAEYLHAASGAGWHLIAMTDETAATAAYWHLRTQSGSATGSEEFMEEAFESRLLRYWILAFEAIPRGAVPSPILPSLGTEAVRRCP